MGLGLEELTHIQQSVQHCTILEQLHDSCTKSIEMWRLGPQVDGLWVGFQGVDDPLL